MNLHVSGVKSVKSLLIGASLSEPHTSIKCVHFLWWWWYMPYRKCTLLQITETWPFLHVTIPHITSSVTYSLHHLLYQSVVQSRSNSVWYCLVVCGTAWQSVVLPGSVWYCLVVSGAAWQSVVLPGCQWQCMVLPGSLWYCLVQSCIYCLVCITLSFTITATSYINNSV